MEQSEQTTVSSYVCDYQVGKSALLALFNGFFLLCTYSGANTEGAGEATASLEISTPTADSWGACPNRDKSYMLVRCAYTQVCNNTYYTT